MVLLWGWSFFWVGKSFWWLLALGFWQCWVLCSPHFGGPRAVCKAGLALVWNRALFLQLSAPHAVEGGVGPIWLPQMQPVEGHCSDATLSALGVLHALKKSFVRPRMSPGDPSAPPLTAQHPLLPTPFPEPNSTEQMRQRIRSLLSVCQ